jgi:hypothetical protein
MEVYRTWQAATKSPGDGPGRALGCKPGVFGLAKLAACIGLFAAYKWQPPRLLEGVIEIMNLQPRGPKAKPYQVRQVRNILVKYRLGANDDQPIWNHHILE